MSILQWKSKDCENSSNKLGINEHETKEKESIFMKRFRLTFLIFVLNERKIEILAAERIKDHCVRFSIKTPFAWNYTQTQNDSMAVRNRAWIPPGKLIVKKRARKRYRQLKTTTIVRKSIFNHFDIFITELRLKYNNKMNRNNKDIIPKRSMQSIYLLLMITFLCLCFVYR